ncbi:MAG: acyl-CoA dehydrogenase family protein, partial [Rhodococcus sp. (in: high G+C Gram-positive bacteria)]|uniref:acyl-CoA dehydrogenase family protein n=1 Tax=Rhodococcus sp. TaxID=1831 RepID=UPI003BAE8DDB
MNVEEFRADVRAWLDEHDLSPGPDHSLDGQVAQLNRVRGALYAAGWMRHGWPTEVGGLGGPAVLRAVLGEEVATRDLAEPGIYSMIEVLAPTMISYARPELAAEMVPLLLSGREQWCQGFSEPGSGSDLASLSTRAVARGDSWVINGQKVWTSLAQYSSRCVLLTRTAPGHDGITAFFVDMDTPGITVRPLRTMHGVDEFAEVYFDDVVVPADRMLGRPGDGWRVAMDLLPHERSTCFWHRIAYLFTRLDRLIAETDIAADADLGAAYLALHTVRCRSRGTQQRLAAGAALGPETSID